MIEAILVLIAALLAAVWVARPLVMKGGDDMVEPDDRLAVETEKRRALTALLDLEEDESAGKLTADDAGALRAAVEREALRAIDRHPSPRDADAGSDDLEREIAAAARRLR